MHHLLFLSFYFSFRKKVSSNEDLRNENFAGIEFDRHRNRNRRAENSSRIRLKEVRCLPRFYVTNRRALISIVGFLLRNRALETGFPNRTNNLSTWFGRPLVANRKRIIVGLELRIDRFEGWSEVSRMCASNPSGTRYVDTTSR